MATRENTERQARAIQELREAITKYGRAAGEALVHERYKDVSRSTWLRWRKAVVAHPLDVAAEKIREAVAITPAEVLPAAPPPAAIVRHPGEGPKALDFMARFEELYQDAEALKLYAAKVDETGKVVGIRVPTFWKDSISLRSGLLERWIQAMNLMFDAKHMQALYDAIVDEISAENPEVAQRIMSRLAALNEERGFTQRGRI